MEGPQDQPGSGRRRSAYLAWIIVCLVWGTTYMGIRVSLETMPPALMGGLRWMIAGSLLAIGLRATGRRLPRAHHWGPAALLGFLMLFLGNGGVVVAEQWIPSGLAAVLVASAPFWMVGIEALIRNGERPHAGAIAGLVIGFGGILVLVWPELHFDSADSRRFLAGVFAVQVACLGWSMGSSYSKRQSPGENVIGLSAMQMLFGGLMMVLAGTVRGEWHELWFNQRSAAALAYLSTLGSVGGFVAYTYALRHLPVSFVSLYAFINPIIAVTLGVVLLDEPFTGRMAAAAALVFAGVAIVRISRPTPASPPRTIPASAGERRTA